ncbi:MAG: hypothetical protein K9L68_08395 [Spirochaetales bacterium]|nr:hypothetical protein [Spirochaetales bacterium]
MKINRIELIEISIPFTKPYALSKVYGTIHSGRAIIFKVHTDKGLTGLGEADPMPPFTSESISSVMAVSKDILCPRLLGREPHDISKIDAELDQALQGNLIARGALNMALYDLLGKACQLPVHVLLGGLLQDRLPLLWPLGSCSIQETFELIEEFQAKGFQTFMLKMGAQPVNEEIKRVRQVRERFGDNVFLIADANQGWEEAEALQFVDGTRDCPVDLLEQPLPHWDREGHRKLRQRSTCPMSADESLTSPHQAAALIREGSVSGFSIKVSKNGGLNMSKQIALTAHTFGLKCLMNSMLEFGISQAALLQLGCTLPNLYPFGHAYMSVLRMRDDITDFADNTSGGVVHVPDKPGLGVSLLEDKLKQYTQSSWTIEH